MIRIKNVGMESTQVEKELVWYVKDFDLDYLERNSTRSQLQEQYSIMKPHGQLRVRAVDRKEFIFTSKAWVEGKEGKLESEHEVDEGAFEIFKYIADSGMVKRRYFLDVEGGVMEVDVFFDDHTPTGNVAPWAKIDFEYKGALGNVPVIPFSYSEAISDDPANRTPEHAELIKKLYKDYFTC